MNPCLSVQAVVNDNVQNSSLEQTIGLYSDTQESQTVFGVLQKILNNLSTFSSFFGIGREIIVPTDAQYSSATLIEKINYLEKQNETLISNMALLDTKVQNVYVTAASNAYANAQVRSVVATGVAPSEILVKWDCTKDVNCTSNSSYPDRIDDSMIKEFRVYCSDKDASVKNMVLRGTVPYDAGKLYTADYQFAINKLSPDKTYYVWVTAVIDDADGIELKDNSSVKVTKTLTISSTKVTELTATPTNGTTLSVSWKDDLTRTSTKSSYISSYRVCWSTSSLTSSNVLSCTSYKTITTCSTSITGLTAGTYYYIAVVPIVRDTSMGSSGKLKDAVNVIYTPTVILKAFSDMTWKEIQLTLDTSCLEMENWNIGDCSSDGWYIVDMTNNSGATKDSIKIWKKQNLGNSIFSTAYNRAAAYYNTFNNTNAITGAYSSYIPSVSELQTGWFANISNRAYCAYWTSTVKTAGTSLDSNQYYIVHHAYATIASGTITSSFNTPSPDNPGFTRSSTTYGYNIQIGCVPIVCIN